jgi:ankyrin repeat protein
VADRIAILWRDAYEQGVTFELVRELLQLDSTQAEVQQYGLTMLHMAAGHHCHEGIALLLANGAEVNAVDSCGETALHRAAWNLDPEGCRQLLGAGADPTMRDSHGRTPLDLAVNGSIQASPEEWETTQTILGQVWVKIPALP